MRARMLWIQVKMMLPGVVAGLCLAWWFANLLQAEARMLDREDQVWREECAVQGEVIELGGDLYCVIDGFRYER